MNLAKYSLDNTKIVYFFLAVLLIGGILSFGRLGKKEDAPFVIKSAVIMTRYPGAEPAEVERLVTEPISREIQSMSGVYKIKSESMYGLSKITFELQPSLSAASIPQKWDELRRKVLNIQPQLPAGSSVPTVSDDFGDVFGIYYGLVGDDGFSYEEMRNWYDGYRFGSTDVYCPWDVLNHCDKIKENAAAFPENYWVHTSSNEAVKKIIQMSGNITTKREIERLLAGEEIVKEIRQELTYQEMYQSVENIWSLLFMTGYLTQRQRLDASHYKLAIPNLEVRDIFKTQIMEYFKEGVAKDGDTLKQLCDALKGGDAEKVERLFEGYLKKTISIRDTFVEKSLKENFYHGILLGILGVKEDWGVFSNRETGDGYSDIMIETEDSEMGIIIEIKYAGDGNLLNACEKALKQVEETKYEETLLENGVEKILKYGIACYMKHCKVMCSER